VRCRSPTAARIVSRRLQGVYAHRGLLRSGRTRSAVLIRTPVSSALNGWTLPSLLRVFAASLLLLLLSGGAAAEEISLLAGATETDDHTSGTYAWGLEYRQLIVPHLTATFGYLNEGHLPDHHRDGGLLQLWADTDASLGRFALALGVGPYAYFDTQQGDNYQGYVNEHGLGVVISGRVTYAFTPHWLGLLELEQVLVPGSVNTRILMVGAGYRLSRFNEELAAQRGQPGAALPEAPNELGLFVGETTLNNLRSDKSTDFGIEYRYRALRHLDLSASLLQENDGAVENHAGITTEAWVVQDFFSRRLEVGLGLGPYAALSAYHTADGRSGASVLGLASMTLGWRFTRALVLRINWHRAFTGDDEDRDILTAGLAWRF